MIGQIIFLLLLATAGYLAFLGFSKVWRNIHLGKKDNSHIDTSIALRNVLLVAFGQKKMFKKWLPAVLHFFIYAAFLITQIELLEIISDGLTGIHRLFSGLGGFYTFLISTIEVLSLLALIATIIFLWRRNILKVDRFQQPEMSGWPRLDANLILMGECILVLGIFTMNGADLQLQMLMPDEYPNTGPLAISQFISPLLFESYSSSTLIVLERIGWWLHVIVVFGFMVYLPWSKHLHIFLAFPNTWFASQRVRGQMENMPEIMNEVRTMMGLPLLADNDNLLADELPEFGANDVTGLSNLDILGAYTCTECGRCTQVCPANITGKKLSPRKIMMDVRDRAEEIGNKIKSAKSEYIKPEAASAGLPLTAATFQDGQSLFNRIRPEEIHACTTCNACVEACPVMISPLNIIMKLRRYEILTDSTGPTDWLAMFNSMESSQSAWQIPMDRDQWAKDAVQ